MMQNDNNSKELPKNTVQSVERAFDLLDLLADTTENTGLSLAELSDGAQLNKSTAHRLLSTLIRTQYVRQDSISKRYFLGSRCLRLHNSADTQNDLRNIAMDTLQNLAEKTNELVNLTNREVIYIAQACAGHRVVGMFTVIGSQAPLHCTGVGKAILAHLPQPELDLFLSTDTLKSYTIHTITNEFQLRKQLEQIREDGYSVDNEEREIGVRCIAAPIFQANGKVVGAVSVSGPPARLNPSQDHELSVRVIHAAAEISKQLGYDK
ncbi:MAG: IclR family transcriptional regulator [Anaerolineales bacterium]